MQAWRFLRLQHFFGTFRHRNSSSSHTRCVRASSAAMPATAKRELAVVRSPSQDEALTITLTLAGQQRFMRRAKNEPLAKTLGRMQMNAVPKPAKKLKKEKNGAPASVPPVDLDVGLFVDDAPTSSPVAGSTLNQEAWQQGNVLRVGDVVYDVIYNPPTLDKVIVHGLPMLGHPLCPVPTMHFAEEQACKWQWYRASENDWEAIYGAISKVYTPQEADLGCRLKVVCTPGSFRENEAHALLGDPASFELNTVRQGPGLTAGAHRHPLTQQQLEPPGMRVVTYNILADQYMAKDYAQKVLFASCPPEFRAAEYRRPLILQELLGFNADVICLQEVDEKAFTQYFLPQFQHAGFDGYYTNKAGKTMEGSATIFRRSRYRMIAQEDLLLNKFLQQLVQQPPQQAAALSGLVSMLSSSPYIMQALQKVATIAQLTILAPEQSDGLEGPLCIANTHLFYHPSANHIRTIQTAVILAEASALIDRTVASADLASSLQGQRPALLFCGDLNSGLNKGMPGALELLSKGRLPKDYWDWESGRTFRYVKESGEDGEEAGNDSASTSGVDEAKEGAGEFQPVELTIPFQLATADNFKTPFTNYVNGYIGALDYIWYEPERMTVQREIPLPEESELAGWIPSERFPSDHLAVVFDLAWQKQQAASNGVTSMEQDSRSGVLPAEESQIPAAVTALRQGAVIAVPTDTLYGLAACANSAEGVESIYRIKQRSAERPLAICVASAADIARYANVTHLPAGLLEDLLPGPVTVLLPRRADAPLYAQLNPGLSTLGVRVPASPFIRAVCAAHGGAVALTSANKSAATSSVTVEEFAELWPQCAAVFDGSRIEYRREGSTIVNLSAAGTFKVQRAGIALQQTRNTLKHKYKLEEQLT